MIFRFSLCTKSYFDNQFDMGVPRTFSAKGFVSGGEPWSYRVCSETGRISSTHRVLISRGRQDVPRSHSDLIDYGREYLQSAEGLTVVEWKALDVTTVRVVTWAEISQWWERRDRWEFRERW